MDAHVHVMPERLFAAVRAWFDEHGWPIRYRPDAAGVAAFLFSRGVSRALALPYAHKPGIARGLNAFVAALCRAEPRLLGGATVFPGEEDAPGILREAFAEGLRAVKIHCHVQCVAPDDPRLHEVLATCAEAGVPVVMHAGREPSSPAYRCDPHALCSAERVDRVLRDHPRLSLVVPHLGADEYAAFARLMERHDHLWLDTTMAISGYFPGEDPSWVVRVRPGRVLYGTDFPNIPYAWDRELKRLLALRLRGEELAAVLGGNALALFAGPRDVARRPVVRGDSPLPEASMNSRVLYQVLVQVAPEAERSWNEWNSQQHIPDVLRQPGFVGATKFRCEPGGGHEWPEYLVQYELSSRAALEAYLAGDAVVRLRHEHEERFGDVTRISRRILVPTAQHQRAE